MRKCFFLIAMFLVIKTEAQSSVLTQADDLYSKGNYSAAINEYAKLGTINANMKIAKAYNAIGNYDKAIAQYKDIVVKNSKIELARFELGKLLLKTKKASLAHLEFEALIKNNPNNPEYLYYLARAKEDEGNFDEAIVDYEKAVVIDSTHLRSIYRIGRYYIAKKESILALKYIDKGLQFYENDVSLISLKAQAFFNNYQYEESASLFERLVTLGEEKAYIYNKLAYCYFKMYEFEKALDNYRSVLKIQSLNPDPTTYTKMAEVFRKDRQLDSAKIYVQTAIDEMVVVLDKEYGMLAGIAREENKLVTALKYYKLAAKEAPEQLMYAYQICAIGDSYHKDPKKKLKCYQDFKKKVEGSKTKSYFSVMTDKRISDLKSEIFANGN